MNVVAGLFLLIVAVVNVRTPAPAAFAEFAVAVAVAMVALVSWPHQGLVRDLTRPIRTDS